MDKIKYSINDLNTQGLNIVCRIHNEDGFNLIKSLCPNMYEWYDEKCDCYLTSRGGRGKEYHYLDGLLFADYNIINICDIEGFEWYVQYNVFVYSNGVPVDWEGEL